MDKKGIFFILLIVKTNGLFHRITDEVLRENTQQLNYGIAISDVDHDGDMDIIVAGYNGPNLVLKYNKEEGVLHDIAKENTPYAALMDSQGAAIGVCACDIDGDGIEEIYFLNTNQAYAGEATYKDALFKWRYNGYENIMTDEVNKDLAAVNFAGRSVACVDRKGTGKYAVVLATYSDNTEGAFAMIEVDFSHKSTNVAQGILVLKNVAQEAGTQLATGGRGIVVGPILENDGKLDIMFTNEGNGALGNRGSNFLFKNNGDGTFTDVASVVEVADETGNGRGITLADVNHDGKLDIIYGNWMGNHHIYIQQSVDGQTRFGNIATPEFASPSPIRTVIAADFDNDGFTEIFQNNIVYTGPSPNHLFRIVINGTGGEPRIEEINIGDAQEPWGYGTGGAYVDFNHDGFLELITSHGESNEQELEIYSADSHPNHNWIRFFVTTRCGAPARGATVKLYTPDGDMRLQVIDSGSGYLCQMEPVAHFGLGEKTANKVVAQWPDGETVEIKLGEGDFKKQHNIEHPDVLLCKHYS